MKTALWIALAFGLGCGGGAAPTSPALVNKVSKPRPSPHVSRHALVDAAFASLVAGDVERLVALANISGIYDGALSCASPEREPDALEQKLRGRLRKPVQSARGATIEVLAMTALALDESATIAKGERKEGCTARADVAFHAATVRLRVRQGDEPPRERVVNVGLVEIEDRWYLHELPDPVARSEAEEALAHIQEFSRRMCECKDKACADQVNEDYMRWGQEMARNLTAREPMRPDPELTKLMADAATRYTECYTKLAMLHVTP